MRSRTAFLPVLLVQRAVEEILSEIAVVGGTVLHLEAAVGAVDQTGKNTASTGAGHAVSLLTDHLNLLKHIIFDDTLMSAGENRLLLYRIFPLLLVPDGVGVGLEVDSTARALPAFQNFDNRAVTPAMGIFRVRVRLRPCCFL